MDFKDKVSRSIQCKMNCIPLQLCEPPENGQVLMTVYGFV